jgi:hypothetical protein
MTHQPIGKQRLVAPGTGTNAKCSPTVDHLRPIASTGEPRVQTTAVSRAPRAFRAIPHLHLKRMINICAARVRHGAIAPGVLRRRRNTRYPPSPSVARPGVAVPISALSHAPFASAETCTRTEGRAMVPDDWALVGARGLATGRCAITALGCDGHHPPRSHSLPARDATSRVATTAGMAAASAPRRRRSGRRRCRNWPPKRVFSRFEKNFMRWGIFRQSVSKT